MGMRRVAIATPGAGIGIYLTLHIVMPQGICLAVLVAIPAGTGMDGISALCAGGLDNSGRIIMGMGRDCLTGSQTTRIIGKGQAGIGGIRGGFRLYQTLLL